MRLTHVATAAVITLAMSMPVAAASKPTRAPERFEAFAVDMTSTGRASSGTIQFTIDRWSTSAERDRLKEAFLKGGQDALLVALQNMPAIGRLATPGTLGNRIRFAMEVPGEDGGQRILALTDRYVGFWEAVNRPRSIDYPFTVVDFTIGDAGEGSGRLMLATRLTLDKKTNTLEVEHYSIAPIRLMSVTKVH